MGQLAYVILSVCCVANIAAFRVPSPSPHSRGLGRGGVSGLRSQQGPSKGFNVLELTGAVIPQGALVKGVKTGWRLAWTTLMKVCVFVCTLYTHVCVYSVKK